MFPNDYGILRRPPCLQSHARCWFQVDLFMARLTQISPKNHTPSPVETGETSQLWRDSSKANVSQRLWNLKAPAMSPITCPLLVSSGSLHGPTDSNLPKKSHTFSGLTGETSQLWRISRFFQGRNISPENRTSGDVGSLVKVPTGEVGPMVKDFYQKKTRKFWCVAFVFDSLFLLVTSFFLWATQKKTWQKLLKDSDTLQLKYPFHRRGLHSLHRWLPSCRFWFGGQINCDKLAIKSHFQLGMNGLGLQVFLQKKDDMHSVFWGELDAYVFVSARSPKSASSPMRCQDMLVVPAETTSSKFGSVHEGWQLKA